MWYLSYVCWKTFHATGLFQYPLEMKAFKMLAYESFANELQIPGWKWEFSTSLKLVTVQ